MKVNSDPTLVPSQNRVPSRKFTQKDIADASFFVTHPRVLQQESIIVLAAAGKILISGATDVDNWSLSRA
jgi:hypothetical protein